MCERKISVGCVLPVFIADDDLPHVAQVTLLLACGQKYFVFTSYLETKYFVDHMHVFVVESTTHSVIVEDLGHLFFFYPLSLYMQSKGQELCEPLLCFFHQHKL